MIAINKWKRQAGSTLVVAIFVLVALLAFGLTMANIFIASAESVAYEVLGTRAYLAANSGAQQRLNQIFQPGQPALDCDGNPDDPLISSFVERTSTPINDSIASTALLNCRVRNVTCTNFKQDNILFYRITSTGQCPLGADQWLSRTITVEARQVN